MNRLAMEKIVGYEFQDDKFWTKLRSYVILRKSHLYYLHLPDADQIINQVEWILEDRDKLSGMAKQGIAYVEKYHDCKNVAGMFLNRWSF